MPILTQYNVTSENVPMAEFPLHHPRILYKNVLGRALSYQESQGTQETVENAVMPSTADSWEFTGFCRWTAFFATDFEFDSICIGAHNLKGTLVTFSYKYNDQVIDILTKEIKSNDAIFIHTRNKFLAREIRITVNTSQSHEVSYISAGIALQMQQPIFDGHIPITSADQTEYYYKTSESGEYLGADIRSRGYETKAKFDHIDDAWFRLYFDKFIESTKTEPFFFAWNLLEYPNDVGLCWLKRDINAPMVTGKRPMRTINMDLLGVG